MDDPVDQLNDYLSNNVKNTDMEQLLRVILNYVLTWFCYEADSFKITEVQNSKSFLEGVSCLCL